MTRPEPPRARQVGDPDQETWSRLSNYVKYAALVKYQEEALEDEDLDRFEDLADARAAIQKELGQEPAPRPELETLDPKTRECFERAYENFREAVERDVRLQSRLTEMKQAASTEMEQANGRDQQLKEYLVRDEVPAGKSKGRLNIRL
jgi:hypothetical protein